MDFEENFKYRIQKKWREKEGKEGSWTVRVHFQGEKAERTKGWGNYCYTDEFKEWNAFPIVESPEKTVRLMEELYGDQPDPFIVVAQQ